jgi:uncharacterized protein YjbI with pentapeptide repeats
MQKRRQVISIALCALFGLSGAYFYMENTIQPLPEKWNNVFKDTPNAITQFAAENPIHLKNVRVVDHDLSDSIIPNATFENVEWKDFVAIDSKFTNTEFIGGSIESSGFSRSIFTNVTFENMTLYNVEFISATLIGVTFKNCKIYDSKIHSLHNSKVTFEDSELNNVEFFDSELDITLKNTKVIEQGKFSGLKPGSRVTLEDSYIGPYSSFKYSNITSFKAVRSELDRFSMGESIGEMTLENSKLDFTLGDASIDRLIVTDCEVDRLSHSDALIKHASISNCKNSTEVFFIKSALGDLNIRDCDLSELGIFESKVSKINIANSKFIKTVSPKTVTKEFILHNVTFLGETDFKGAQADDTELFKVTFAPSATLDATGSNIPFKQ